MNGMTLTIKGLFGHFNYEIPLYGLDNSDGIPMSSGVTILTGPNGYGKTTILRALEAVSKGDLSFFFSLKFDKFILEVNDNEAKQCFSIISGQGDKKRLDINGKTVFPELHSIPLDEISQYFSTLEQSEANQKTMTELSESMRKIFPPTFIIQEQRLLHIQNVTAMRDGELLELKQVTGTVSTLPEKMKTRLSSASNNYSEIDAWLNASFPSRVLSQPDNGAMTQEEFDQLYQNMNDKLRVLHEYGLSTFKPQDIPAFQAEKGGILRVFFDDFNRKYKAYELLIEKLTLFRSILNRRFREFKRVEISRKYGLQVRDIHVDDSGAEIPGDVIPLEKLSSGEQETLILYYRLIFETTSGTMLLIDEPEISLHIAWQRTFIDELKEIVRLNGLRAVVATHSSSIIGRHRDIQVDLGALYQDELERQENLYGQGA